MDNPSDREDVEIANPEEIERVTDPSAVDGDVNGRPEWSRDLVSEFGQYTLRPYRPSRSAEGETVQEAVREMEGRCSVEIRIKSADPGTGGPREFIADGSTVPLTTRKRTATG